MILIRLNRIGESLNRIQMFSNDERAAIQVYMYKLYSALHEDHDFVNDLRTAMKKDN